LIVLQRPRVHVAQCYADISALIKRTQQVMNNDD
jgi:hypothetical protein